MSGASWRHSRERVASSCRRSLAAAREVRRRTRASLATGLRFRPPVMTSSGVGRRGGRGGGSSRIRIQDIAIAEDVKISIEKALKLFLADDSASGRTQACDTCTLREADLSVSLLPLSLQSTPSLLP